MKYQATDSRVYPDLGITVSVGDVVELPAGIEAAGLSPIIVESSKGKPVAPADTEKVGE